MVDLKWKQRGLKESIHFQNVFPSKLNLKQWAWNNCWNLKMYFLQNSQIEIHSVKGALHLCLRNFVRLSKMKMGKMHLGGVPPWCHRFFAQNGRQFCCELQMEIQIQIHFEILHNTNTATGFRLEFPAWNWSHEIAKGKTVTGRKLKAPQIFSTFFS